MSDDVEAKVIGILAEQAVLDRDQVTLESTPEELGLDSLGLVETVFAIEEGFDINVPFNANDPTAGEFDISSVRAIVAAVKTLIAEQKG